MKVFLDTADMKEIEAFAEMGFIDGVTTNPGIIKKQGDITVDDFLARAVDIVECVSVQLAGPSDDYDRYLKLGHKECDVLVKIPFCKWGLEIMSQVPSNVVNLTGITSKGQAVMGASLKPKILSIFWNRILDEYKEEHGGELLEPRSWAKGIVQIALRTRWADSDGDPLTEILVGSLRKSQDILDAAEAGATVITARPDLWRELMDSKATNKILEEWYGST